MSNCLDKTHVADNTDVRIGEGADDKLHRFGMGRAGTFPNVVLSAVHLMRDNRSCLSNTLYHADGNHRTLCPVIHLVFYR